MRGGDGCDLEEAWGRMRYGGRGGVGSVASEL